MDTLYTYTFDMDINWTSTSITYNACAVYKHTKVNKVTAFLMFSVEQISFKNFRSHENFLKLFYNKT